MVTQYQIQEVVNQIVRLCQPEKVILFGSQANGAPNEDSDVDLLVMLDFEGDRRLKAAQIRAALNAPFSMDLLVRRYKDLDADTIANDFVKEILETGKTLYESQNRRVGS